MYLIEKKKISFINYLDSTTIIGLFKTTTTTTTTTNDTINDTINDDNIIIIINKS
jgi:hypothetical protein